MKAKRLAAILLEAPEAEVVAWDPDAERYQAVTGCVLKPGNTFEDGEVKIQTDIEP